MWIRSRLTASQPYDSVSVDFDAVVIVVANPTASAILIRVGAPDIPDVTNYDEIVPAGQNAAIPCNAREFGVAFNQPASIAAAAATKSGLFLLASVKFQTADEPVPAYGSASFLSLSTSDVLPLVAFAGPTLSPVIDVGAWGGLLLHVNPSAGSGQGVVSVLISADAVTFRTFATYAFWPNAPATLTIPRVARYVQISIAATAIAGEPAIAGFYSIRETLQEVTQLTYTPSSQPISKAFALTATQTQQWQFVTVGLPAVSLAAISTAGSSAGEGIILNVEASADLVNWRQVTQRNQVFNTGRTLYRAMGNLDLFMRVTVLENAGLNGNGTLYLSIPPVADLGSILNTIQQSLGDNLGPTGPATLDIYHELDAVRIQTAGITALLNSTLNIETYDLAIKASVASIDTKESTELVNTGAIATNTNLINGNAGNIAANTAASAASDASIDTKLSTVNTNLGTLHTDLNTTLHGDVNGASGFLTTLAAAQTRSISQTNGIAQVLPGSGWNLCAAALPAAGLFIFRGSLTFAFTGAAGAPNRNIFGLAYGTGLAPTVVLMWKSGIFQPVAGVLPATWTMDFDLNDIRSGGLLSVAGSLNIWVYSGIGGGLADYLIWTV